MNVVCDVEDLEALLAGELAPERADAVRAHAESCPACHAELIWLEEERVLMAKRAAQAPAPEDLWAGMEERLQAAPPRRRRFTLALASTTIAAATAFLVLLHIADKPFVPNVARQAAAVRPPPKPLRDDASRVLDEAERAWAHAAQTLEQQWATERARLQPETVIELERSLDRARSLVADARARARAAGDEDYTLRQASIDGQAGYVHALQQMLTDLEVVP